MKPFFSNHLQVFTLSPTITLVHGIQRFLFDKIQYYFKIKSLSVNLDTGKTASDKTTTTPH